MNNESKYTIVPRKKTAVGTNYWKLVKKDQYGDSPSD